VTNIILTFAMVASFALFYGAWKLSRLQDWGQKSLLMIAAGLIIIANVAIWSIPDKNGNTLANTNTEQ
jgi:hypothetical protein